MRLPILLATLGLSTALAGCQTTALFSANFNSDPVGPALTVPAGSPNNSAIVFNSTVSNVAPLEGTKSLVLEGNTQYIATLQDDRADPNSTNLYYSWEQQVTSGDLFVLVQYGTIRMGDPGTGAIRLTIRDDELFVASGDLRATGTRVGSCDFSRDVFFILTLERATGVFKLFSFGPGCRLTYETSIPPVMLGSLENRVPALWFTLQGTNSFARFDTIRTSYREPTTP